jgi:hypothetical protein
VRTRPGGHRDVLGDRAAIETPSRWNSSIQAIGERQHVGGHVGIAYGRRAGWT